MTIRPRRSVLYMPGSNARAMEKARELPVDAVILDLEDAVAPDAKAKARELIVEALKNGGFGRREVLVRINGLDTAWWLDDLAVAAAGPDAVLVPKVSAPEQVRQVAKHLTGVRATENVRIWAMMETPLAMLNARDIAAAALDADTRLAGFVMGTNDLAKDTRARILPGRTPMLPWLMICVAAARAFGLDILDGVYNDLGYARALPPSARRRATSASTARRSFIRSRSRPATPLSRRTTTKWLGRGKSSPLSINLTTPPRASYRSTAAWSSGCMPTWRGARWRSRTRSPRVRRLERLSHSAHSRESGNPATGSVRNAGSPPSRDER